MPQLFQLAAMTKAGPQICPRDSSSDPVSDDKKHPVLPVDHLERGSMDLYESTGTFQKWIDGI